MKQRLRLGLCCAFAGEPIRFRRTTASYLARLRRRERLAFLRDLAADNALALGLAVDWCAARGVGAFRITSQLLPVYTHPEMGYRVEEIDRGGTISAAFAAVRDRAASERGRLSFHPDQFVVPGSIRDDVALRSLVELEYMGLVAEIVGAEQVTLHGGGAQGGKKEALGRLARGLDRLTDRARTRIALENDDCVYTVEDLLPLCRTAGIPLVYDAHHHRCNPDSLRVEEATRLTAETWGPREPWAHISSPKGGWRSRARRLHADFIEQHHDRILILRTGERTRKRDPDVVFGPGRLRAERKSLRPGQSDWRRGQGRGHRESRTARAGCFDLSRRKDSRSRS